MAQSEFGIMQKNFYETFYCDFFIFQFITFTVIRHLHADFESFLIKTMHLLFH